MIRYKLRTLLIAGAIGPPLIAVAWLTVQLIWLRAEAVDERQFLNSVTEAERQLAAEPNP